MRTLGVLCHEPERVEGGGQVPPGRDIGPKISPQAFPLSSGAMTNEPTPTPPIPPAPRGMTDAERQNWAVAAHFSALVAFLGIPSVVGPLVVWLIKKDEDDYIAAHAVHALNFNISVLIYTVVAVIATAIIGVATFGLALLVAIPVLVVAFIAWLIFVIQAGLAASRGQEFRYPATIDFIK